MNAVVERRPRLRETIPEIERAAVLMSKAAEGHLASDRQRAAGLLLESNLPAVRAWRESLWGKKSLYTPVHKKMVPPGHCAEGHSCDAASPESRIHEVAP